tara:strand:+ start:9712 stop:10005 length:294 start_codon:yes stop_codon:yes gene_type:complete
MFNEPEPRDPKGYSDNGHIEFECDFCGNELVDIWKVKESDFITKIKLFCDDCNEPSFPKEVSGKIYVGCTENSRVTQILEKDGLTIVHACLEAPKDE